MAISEIVPSKRTLHTRKSLRTLFPQSRASTTYVADLGRGTSLTRAIRASSTEPTLEIIEHTSKSPISLHGFGHAMPESPVQGSIDRPPHSWAVYVTS